MHPPSQISNSFTALTGTRYPIIMAPMFLVSNLEMMTAGMRSGILPVFPSLNYRDDKQLEATLEACNLFKTSPENQGSYGVNLIVQQTNIFYRRHLELCMKARVPFYITSLGNPQEVIQRSREYGAKVFCDVTNLKHAEKAVKLGCDGLIAVGQGAGGHAGPNALIVMLPALRREFPGISIVAAGGVSTGEALLSVIAAGADAASVGTRFIACTEATVRKEYKEAILAYGMDDIVMTDKISGTPCAVINTPFVQKSGTRLGFFGRWLNRNRRTKKFFKGLTQLRGMKLLEKAAFNATYETMWCAGQSIEMIEEILTVEEIVQKLVNEYETARMKIPALHKTETR